MFSSAVSPRAYRDRPGYCRTYHENVLQVLLNSPFVRILKSLSAIMSLHNLQCRRYTNNKKANGKVVRAIKHHALKIYGEVNGGMAPLILNLGS